MHENADKLIPDLALWNNGTGIDLSSWVGCIGRYDHVIGYAALLWPDFVVYDDCVLIGQPITQRYEEWLKYCGGDKRCVEGMLNHCHIVDLFSNSEFAPTKEIVLYIGRLLKDMWSCKLKRDFPDRNITVELYGTDSDDLVDHQISFFQRRS